MNRTLGFLLLLAGCATPLPNECSDLGAYERRTVPRSFQHSNGVVSATGRGLPSDWDDTYERKFPAVRLGRWMYWYDTGAKQAEVNYAFACYIQCCTAGPCPQINDYPIGTFALWYPSGRKLGEGTFETVTSHVNTSCEGGDDTKAGRIAKTSRFWREDGTEMTLAEARTEGLLLEGW